MIKIFTSDTLAEAALGFGDIAAVVMLAVKSEALPGFFNTLVANFSPALAEILPRFLKKTT